MFTDFSISYVYTIVFLLLIFVKMMQVRFNHIFQNTNLYYVKAYNVKKVVLFNEIGYLASVLVFILFFILSIFALFS